MSCRRNGIMKRNAEPATEECEGEDARRFKIETKKDESRKREDDAGSDRLAGVPDRLHDVVLQDRGLAEGAKDGDGKHGDRNRCRDCQAGAKSYINRHCAEEHGEDGPQKQCAKGELGA